MPIQLPHRFRETQFRRYEDTIAQIVRDHPKVSTFVPNLSTVTFSNRLRDAMRSLHEHRWETSKIDVVKFLSLFPDFIAVGERASIVIAGPPDALRVYLADLGTATTINGPLTSEVIRLPTIDSLRALALLLHQRVLTGPYHFELPNTPHATIADAVQTYDVSLSEPSDKGVYTLL